MRAGTTRQSLPRLSSAQRKIRGPLRRSRLARDMHRDALTEHSTRAESSMENATYVALSSQMAIQRQMDVVANNLANASTPAFKGEEMLFSQYLVRPSGQRSPIAFVQDAGTVRDLREGPITQTGNPLDLAISGQGYFAVQTPLGVRYTRNGHFQLDSQGQIVTSQGYPVLTNSGQPLVVPANTHGITVATDGTVSVGQDGSGQQ